MPTVKPNIFDGAEHREMTDAEHADYEIEQAARLVREKAQAKDEAERATQKQAVLDRLGITADEAALLLG